MKGKKLDELCDFISGLWTGKKPPYINVGVIRNTNFHKSGNLDFSDIAQLQVEAKQFSTRQLRFGDIVLEKSGGGPKQPVGRVCVFEKNEGLFSLSNFTSAIRVKNTKELDYKYLHYYLKHLYISGETEKIQTHSTGIRNLQLSLYKEFQVPLPPLDTQQKIVAKLDAIFAEIDKAAAAAEANAKNAEALFQSYLTEIFERGGEDWIELLTSDVCFNITDGKHGDCIGEENSGYYFLSAKDVKNGVLNYLGAREITREDFEETHRRTNLECGDVLVTNSGTIGRMAIADDDERTQKTTFQKSVAILKPKSNVIDSKFLFHLLTSKLIHFNNISAGAAQKNLLLRDIRSLKIKIPKELSEQKTISNRFDLMREMVNKLKNLHKTKKIEINQLKQSILKQAFSGELVKE